MILIACLKLYMAVKNPFRWNWYRNILRVGTNKKKLFK